jgi:hypothetical protein
METTVRTTVHSEVDASVGAQANLALVQADLTQQPQLERAASRTGRSGLRRLWNRLCLTVQEMNYASRRIVEVQAPWISDDRRR